MLEHLNPGALKPNPRNAHTNSKKQVKQIAYNKPALYAGWNEQLLAEELEELVSLDPIFEIEATGFSIPESDQLVEGLRPEEPNDPADDLPAPGGPARYSHGDIWHTYGLTTEAVHQFCRVALIASWQMFCMYAFRRSQYSGINNSRSGAD